VLPTRDRGQLGGRDQRRSSIDVIVSIVDVVMAVVSIIRAKQQREQRTLLLSSLVIGQPSSKIGRAHCRNKTST
jgi:hypothetical protein